MQPLKMGSSVEVMREKPEQGVNEMKRRSSNARSSLANAKTRPAGAGRVNLIRSGFRWHVSPQMLHQARIRS